MAYVWVTWQFQSKPAPTRTCDPTLACIESIGNLVMTNDSFLDEPAPFAYVVKWTVKQCYKTKNCFTFTCTLLTSIENEIAASFARCDNGVLTEKFANNAS